MTDTARFSINQNGVSHNRFDDEVIVIHFASGIYFSLRGTAPAIWDLFAESPSGLSDVYGLFNSLSEEQKSEISAFISKLKDSDLILPSTSADAHHVTSTTGPLEYAKPDLEAYSDLQAALLADPIHDTDEGGWPSMPEDPPEA
jgi:hypothetical protein